MSTIGRPCLKQFVIDSLPGTMPELIVKSGVSKSAVFRAIRDLRLAGEIHITKWRYPQHGGRPMPTYVKGSGKDAECKLKPKSAAELSRAFRKRAMKDGRWELRNAAVRARYHADRAAKTPQTWASSLPGMEKRGGRHAN